MGKLRFFCKKKFGFKYFMLSPPPTHTHLTGSLSLQPHFKHTYNDVDGYTPSSLYVSYNFMNRPKKNQDISAIVFMGKKIPHKMLVI